MSGGAKLVAGPRPPAGWGRWLVAGAAAVLAAVLLIGLVRPRPLGHDEATYAVGARALLAGDAADGYPIYRPLAMPLLLVPGVAAGGDAWTVRLPFALGAVGYALVVTALARRVAAGGASGAGTTAATAAALAFAAQVTAAPWLWRACEALSDLPAAAALLGMTLLAIDDAARPRPRAWAWALFAALAIAAIYLRHASAPAVALVGGATFVLVPARRRAVALAAVAIAAAVVPLLVWSHAVTGRMTGVLELSVKMGRREYPGEGLWYYLTHWPTTVAGPVMGAIAIVGVVAGVAAWRRGGDRARRLLVVAALGQIVALGWRVHGEGRYVFFATSALTVLGAAWLAARPRAATVAAWAIAIAAVPSAAVTVRHLERLAGQRAGFVRAAAAIRADAGGERCLVVTGNVPQAIWYARCHGRIAWGPPDDATLAAFPRVYLLAAAGQVRQPDAATLVRPGFRWRPLACETTPAWCVYVPAARAHP